MRPKSPQGLENQRASPPPRGPGIAQGLEAGDMSRFKHFLAAWLDSPNGLVAKPDRVGLLTKTLGRGWGFGVSGDTIPVVGACSFLPRLLRCIREPSCFW